MMSKTIQQKMQITETENLKVKDLINIKPVIVRFMNSSQAHSFQASWIKLTH